MHDSNPKKMPTEFSVCWVHADKTGKKGLGCKIKCESRRLESEVLLELGISCFTERAMLQ